LTLLSSRSDHNLNSLQNVLTHDIHPELTVLCDTDSFCQAKFQRPYTLVEPDCGSSAELVSPLIKTPQDRSSLGCPQYPRRRFPEESTAPEHRRVVPAPPYDHSLVTCGDGMTEHNEIDTFFAPGDSERRSKVNHFENLHAKALPEQQRTKPQ
jgi:hypothetical protein